MNNSSVTPAILAVGRGNLGTVLTRLLVWMDSICAIYSPV